MTKEELLAKYNRIPEDHSQLSQFVKDVVDLMLDPSVRKSIEVNNIVEMTDEECESLHAGDIVVKCTKVEGKIFKHSYVVSFKADAVGMCLTYTDATLIETVSYDFTEGHWVYNSTDKWEKSE